MKRKVIIDCDPGIDDSLAIMLALSSPELDILGITITAGNAPLKQGFENAKKVLNHMDRLDVRVFLGADKPLVKEFVDALDTHGEDGLGESFLPEIEGYIQNINALDFYEKTLSTTKCSIIALGPLTNLAQLAQKNAKAFDQIEEKNPTAFKDSFANPDKKLFGEKESTREFAARVNAIIDKIVSDNIGNRIIIVTHPEVIQAAICNAIDLPLEKIARVYIRTGSATQISYYEDWASLKYSGYVPV